MIGIIKETTMISTYESLCVIPVLFNKVKTAPLCGKVSKPPEDKEAIRWKASGLIPVVLANSIYFAPKAANAIPIPPEAEPVAPANKLTATYSSMTLSFGFLRLVYSRHA